MLKICAQCSSRTAKMVCQHTDPNTGYIYHLGLQLTYHYGIRLPEWIIRHCNRPLCPECSKRCLYCHKFLCEHHLYKGREYCSESCYYAAEREREIKERGYDEPSGGGSVNYY